MKRKRIVPFEKRRYIDFKKKIFEDIVLPEDYEHAIKLDGFLRIPEHLGFGFVILMCIDGCHYTIEGQQVIKGDTIKRGSRFVDVEPTEYYKDTKLEVRMNGSYLHGFHYFADLEDAKTIASMIPYDTEIVEASIYTSNARGVMMGVETHCTCELYLHE